MQKILGLVRRCVEDYDMIPPERPWPWACPGKGLPGPAGFLSELKKYPRWIFDLEAVTIDMGLGMDYSGVRGLCDRLEIPYTIVPTQIGPIIFDYRKGRIPAPCAPKMRRGALNQALLDRKLNKLALGHHYDDAVETFLMSLLFFEGRISCFQPVTHLDRTGIDQIRPMLYLHEKTIDHFAQRENLPILTNRCPVDKITKRAEVKDLLYRLSGEYPDLKERIFGAMQRLPLPSGTEAPHEEKNID